jgi:hypothetical protein
VTVLSYSFQLYYDFSGYSDMAVALARMFGFRLPVNFYSPYKSASIIDFWRRWHITLSRFLRDYLYIPLGGNRRGALRRYVNLGIVMLLGGLWHGPNWTFVLWGGAHGVMLALNHAWRALPLSRSFALKTALAQALAVLVTFTAVTLAWVLFRSETLTDAKTMFAFLWPASGDPLGWPSFSGLIRGQFTDLKSALALTEWFKPRELWPPVLPPDYLAASARPAGLFLLCVALATFTVPNTYQIFGRFKPALWLPEETEGSGILRALDWRVAIIVAGMFLLSVLRLSHVSPFLYYQF